MNIGLIGYGRMGKVIEKIAVQRGHKVTSIVDQGMGEISSEVDCYIDFSVAAAMKTNMTELCKQKVPVVIGTTGWLDDKDFYEKLFQDSGNIGIWGGNFSLGVNLFWKAVQDATKTFNKFQKEYDVMVHEYHHKNKIDSPSGTAIQTADFVLQNSTQKDKIVTECLNRKREDNELHVSSTRGGSIPGIHTVTFDSDFDTVEITHNARTREGFALGSVIAAEKIQKLKSGLYNFSENFDTITEE